MSEREITFYTPKEAAAILGIYTATLKKWMSEGRINAVRLSNRTVRYTSAELDRLAKEARVEARVEDRVEDKRG